MQCYQITENFGMGDLFSKFRGLAFFQQKCKKDIFQNLGGEMLLPEPAPLFKCLNYH